MDVGAPANVRKILNVEEDAHKMKMVDTFYVDFGEELKDDNKVTGEDENCRFVVEMKACEEVKVNASGSSVCKLAVGSLSNIVAYANIDEVLVLEGSEQTIHGVRQIGRAHV